MEAKHLISGLKRVGRVRPGTALVCLIPTYTVSSDWVETLKSAGWEIHPQAVRNDHSKGDLQTSDVPSLPLHLWGMSGRFDRILYIEAHAAIEGSLEEVLYTGTFRVDEEGPWMCRKYKQEATGAWSSPLEFDEMHDASVIVLRPSERVHAWLLDQFVRYSDKLFTLQGFLHKCFTDNGLTRKLPPTYNLPAGLRDCEQLCGRYHAKIVVPAKKETVCISPWAVGG